MRLIIEARLADGDSDKVNDGEGILAVVERRDCGLDQLGLTLAEGRSLLAKGAGPVDFETGAMVALGPDPLPALRCSPTPQG